MKKNLVDLIKVNGPISISNFINEALFNPKHGYYNAKNPLGKKGDFITAPEISQVFGELIGAYLIGLWQGNYKGQEISLVEMGAGKGTLMKDLLNLAAKIPGFLENVTLNIIEISPKLREAQSKALESFNIKWWDNFADFEVQNNKPIFFIANELFDCFAINQYINIDGFWLERMLGIDNDDELQFVFGKKDAQIDKKIKDLTNNKAKNKDIFEHSPASDEFMKSLSAAIKKAGGIALIIDYGYVENEFKDSLQAIKNHKFSNVLKNIGQSDITSLVNFKRLQDLSKEENLENWVVTQKEFLESLGVEIRRKTLLEGKTDLEQKEINSSIDRLISKEEMGELFKVLIVS